VLCQNFRGDMDDPWSALPPPLTGATTHAEHGEDIILKVMFDRLGMPRPRYLDIGAFDPYHINNTAALYASGARGINVEANPELMKAFHRHRPEDLNLNCAVGPERLAARRLYVDENPGLSSFHRELVEHPVAEIQVPTWTIPDILIGHHDGAWPDLLSIDIEGEDIAVLESCLPPEGDRPKVVCVEFLRLTQDYSAQWRSLMNARDYYLFFRTRSNMIWVTDEALAALLG
jgi:FkbM family methyltransferase